MPAKERTAQEASTSDGVLGPVRSGATSEPDFVRLNNGVSACVRTSVRACLHCKELHFHERSALPANVQSGSHTHCCPAACPQALLPILGFGTFCQEDSNVIKYVLAALRGKLLKLPAEP